MKRYRNCPMWYGGTLNHSIENMVNRILKSLQDTKYFGEIEYPIEVSNIYGMEYDYHWGINPYHKGKDICGVISNSPYKEDIGRVVKLESHGSYNGSWESVKYSDMNTYNQYIEKGIELSESEAADDRYSYKRDYSGEVQTWHLPLTKEEQFEQFREQITKFVTKLFLTRKYADFGLNIRQQHDFSAFGGHSYWYEYVFESADLHHTDLRTVNIYWDNYKQELITEE